VPLEWQGGSVVSAELGPRDGWRGPITGVALAVRGKLSQPLVQSCIVPAVSVWTALVEISRQGSVFMDAHSGYPGTVPPPQVWTALVGLGTAFAGQNVGIKEISDKIWFVSFMG
jgi:hypothetical protein